MSDTRQNERIRRQRVRLARDNARLADARAREAREAARQERAAEDLRIYESGYRRSWLTGRVVPVKPSRRQSGHLRRLPPRSVDEG